MLTYYASITLHIRWHTLVTPLQTPQGEKARENHQILLPGEKATNFISSIC